MSTRSRSNPWWGPRPSRLQNPMDLGVRPGVVMVSEPEYVGSFPVRTELTVLPGDPSGRASIGFVMREYSGSEVFKVGSPDEPLLQREDLQPGDRVIVPTLFGARFMTVVEDEDGLHADNDGLLADLKFDVDDRHCWVSTYAINKKALKSLEIMRV